jgi:hypothetical protein
MLIYKHLSLGRLLSSQCKLPWLGWFSFLKLNNILFRSILVLRFPKRVCHTPEGQKLGEEIYFLEIGCFGPRAEPLSPADLTHLPKNYLYGVGLVLKFSSRSFHSIKSYSAFSNRQTDRHIPSRPYSGIGLGNFNASFDTFHFTMFALLTPFVKNKIKF